MIDHQGDMMLARYWQLKLMSTLGGLAVALVLASPAASVPVVYTVTDGGIDTASGCSGAPLFLCGIAGIVFEQDPAGPFPELATGTYTLDETAGTLDVALSVSGLTLTDVSGAVNGVDEVVFSGLTYTGTLTVSGSGDGPYVIDALQTLSVSGTYTQLFGGGTVVGATAFGPFDVDLPSGQCLINAGAMTCGLVVGAQQSPASTDTFVLDIGGAPISVGFQHVFNTVAVVPEPGTAILLGLGLAAVSLRRRRG